MRKYLINLTQHALTDEQIKSVEHTFTPEGFNKYLTFDTMPTAQDVYVKAVDMFKKLVSVLEHEGIYAHDCTVLLGGAPFFMSVCEEMALHYGFHYCYAFSKRTSEEVKQPDGTVKKVSVFKHEGWIGPFEN